MIALHYAHRLPADYDMRLIRDRVARRASQWDDTAGLALKAFVARERGRHGANANAYASVYLWLDAAAVTTFLAGERFRAVVDSFGRPEVHLGLPLAVRAGPAARAVSLVRQEEIVAADADLERLQSEEAERTHRLASHADTVVAWSVLDPTAWRLLRYTLSSAPPTPGAPGVDVLEVLHLAAPGRASLA